MFFSGTFQYSFVVAGIRIVRRESTMNSDNHFTSRAARAFFLLFCLIVLNACATVDVSPHISGGDSGKHTCEAQLQQYLRADTVLREKMLTRETATFQLLAERALVYRTKTIGFYRQLESKIEANEPLSGNELDIMNRGMVDHLEVRSALLDIAHRHECWLDLDEDDLKNSGMSQEHHIKGVMISLAAALVLYDNYLLAVSTFEENPKLRQLLNAQDSGYQIGSNELTKVSLSYVSIENRRRTKKAIQLYERRMEEIRGASDRDPDLSYLSLIIDQSPSYNMTKKWSPLFVIGKSINLFGDVTVDTLNRIGKDGVNLFSMAFGNTIGLIETRKGKLYGKASVEKSIKSSLEPGDILLEKTPFRLTDQFIPGHWGHAAIWIGNEEQLRQLGIWDDPLLTPYHGEIRHGHGIIEALRDGVTMSSFSQFVNVDDIAVLRNRESTPSRQARIVLQAMRQIGKEYDFNFDVETTDKIVCSELIYHSYTDSEWPTVKALGRATISPDNIASKALDHNELDLVLLYHDGQPVLDNPLFRMKELMRGNRLSASF